MQAAEWAGPLAGVKVLDLSLMVAGPYTTTLLGDLGAEIWKVEPPWGDGTRGMAPYVNGESHYFIAINRNKKSLAVDLKQPRGAQVIRDLVRRADVLVENFRPGVMDALGLDYGTLAELNPRLIYCSITGFGTDSPLRDKPSYDIVTQALSGAMSVNGDPDGPPQKIGLPLGDLVGGIYGSLGVVAALFERQAGSGGGRHIDLSLVDGMLGMLGYFAQIYFVTGKNPGRAGSKHPAFSPYGSYPTADGHIVIACLTETFWANFAKALEHPDLLDDPRFTVNEARLKNRDALDAEVSAVMRRRPMAEWQAILEAHDVPHAPILGVGEALEQPHARARDMVVTADHPRAGTLRMVGRPIKYVGMPQRPLDPPPMFGEHTRQILAEELGYAEEVINALEQDGTINRQQ